MVRVSFRAPVAPVRQGMPMISPSQTLSAELLTPPPAGTDGKILAGYRAHPIAFDECFQTSADPHEHCRALISRLGELGCSEFQQRRASADLVFVTQGITFSVYSDRRGVEK